MDLNKTFLSIDLIQHNETTGALSLFARWYVLDPDNVLVAVSASEVPLVHDDTMASIKAKFVADLQGQLVGPSVDSGTIVFIDDKGLL